MIRQTMDPAFLARVANDPSVRPWIAAGDHDLSEGVANLVTNPANVCLVTNHGGWVFQKLDPGIYEAHSLFLPAGRGRNFRDAAREAMRWLFTRTDCIDLLTKCPDDNGAARMAAAMMGFKERFRRDGIWHTGAGVSFQGITIDGWAIRDKAAEEAGEAFHAALEAAKQAAGSEMPVHEADPAHDHFVGAAWLIAEAGNLAKAAAFYNRWAIFAGYGSIAAVGPGMIDIGDAVVTVRDGRTEVLLCR